MAWEKEVWVDDDGSDTVGTPFDADHMNNIEVGIFEGAEAILGVEGVAGSAITQAGSALATGQAANVLAGSALLTGQNARAVAGSGVTAAGSALVTGQDARAVAGSGVAAAGSALVTGQDARAQAGTAFVLAGSALATGQAGSVLAGSALVTAQGASVVAGSALITGQGANVAAGSALASAQNARAVAGSGVTAAGSALTTAQGVGSALATETVGRELADALRPPVLTHDAASSVAAGTGVLTWNHVPVAARPAAILVLISQNWVTSTADQIISVSYGEQLMTRIGENRTASRCAEYAYLLTGKIKPGKQAISVSVSGSASKSAVAVSLNGPQLQRVKAKVLTNVQASTTTPVIEEAVAWDERVVYGVLSSNKNPAPGAGQTELKEVEFASEVFTQWDVNSSNTEPGKAPFAQWGTQTSGTAGMLLVQLGLVKDWGEVTELPTGCCPGDVCHFVADATNNIVWDLEFDNRETAYPWRRTGGDAIRSAVGGGTVAGTGASTAEITAPLAMRFRADFGDDFVQLLTASLTSQVTLTLLANNVENAKSASVASAQFVGGPLRGIGGGTLEKGKKLTMTWNANNGGSWGVDIAYIDLAPLRVG